MEGKGSRHGTESILRIDMMTRITLGLARTVKSHRFALAAFLIPLTIRAIPEILAGPYPIGYDTIASYVPFMHIWASGNFLNYVGTVLGGSLIFAIFGTIYSTTGMDPVFIVKVAGPILYGTLGIAEYIFTRRYMLWSNRRSLLLVLIASIYFVSLRVSMDLMRDTLAMAFLFFTLAVGKDLKSKISSVEFSSLLLLTIITEALVGALVLSLTLIQTISQSGLRSARFVAIIPGITLFTGLLIGFQSAGVQIVSSAIRTVPAPNALAFAFYIFIPIIPLVVLGARSIGSNILRNWILVCLVGLMASATLGSISQLVWPERWSFLMIFPLTVYATNGFLRLRRPEFQLRYPGRLLGNIWILVLIVLAGTYIALPADHAFSYYRFFVPTSMLQSTIPVEDSQEVASAFHWLTNNTAGDSGIMTTEVMRGWASEYFLGKGTVVSFPFGTTLSQALQEMINHGYPRVYTVWWANGSGWYGEPTVPSGFSLVRVFGQFGVFVYVK